MKNMTTQVVYPPPFGGYRVRLHSKNVYSYYPCVITMTNNVQHVVPGSDIYMCIWNQIDDSANTIPVLSVFGVFMILV
jgi:hypothetical protein